MRCFNLGTISNQYILDNNRNNVKSFSSFLHNGIGLVYILVLNRHDHSYSLNMLARTLYTASPNMFSGYFAETQREVGQELL